MYCNGKKNRRKEILRNSVRVQTKIAKQHYFSALNCLLNSVNKVLNIWTILFFFVLLLRSGKAAISTTENSIGYNTVNAENTEMMFTKMKMHIT